MRASYLGLALLITFAAESAPAATQCGSVADFNAAMAASGGSTKDVSVTFDVVGVNPSDFFNTKGSLAQMRNTQCSSGAQDAVIKVYGTSEPLNTAHLPGTLKLEYGNQCCPGNCSEGWASPNPSEVIFEDGSEQCKVTMWIDPATIGYKLECGGVTYDAVGDNSFGNEVDQITLLDYLLAQGGNTWKLENATATNDQACWEAPAPIPGQSSTLTVPVAEDVTAGPTYPSSVFPDVGDLAVEAGDNEAYLKFQVPQVQGKITKATLFLHARSESFAEGNGGEVYAVTDHGWSELSMTWSTRPPRTQTSLGRIGPAASDTWVSLDLGAAITAPGTYSFAIVSPPSDTNGTHFFSKEGNASAAPYLQLSYEPGSAGSGGASSAPDAGAAGWGAEQGIAGAASGGAAGSSSGSSPSSEASASCGVGRGGNGGWLLLLAAVALLRRRR